MYCLCILWVRFFLCIDLFLFTIQSIALYLGRQLIHTCCVMVCYNAKLQQSGLLPRTFWEQKSTFRTRLRHPSLALSFAYRAFYHDQAVCLSVYLPTCLNQMSANVHVDLASKTRCFLGQNLQVLIGCCISRLEYLQLSLEAFYKTAGVRL